MVQVLGRGLVVATLELELCKVQQRVHLYRADAVLLLQNNTLPISIWSLFASNSAIRSPICTLFLMMLFVAASVPFKLELCKCNSASTWAAPIPYSS